MFTIPPLTSDFLAISLDGRGSPEVNLNLPEKVGGNHSLGWGVGWYPNDQQSAMVTKDPSASSTNVLMDTISDWTDFRSTIFFCKVRGAGKGYTHKETQPFCRSYAGRDWLFMHNGDVDKDMLTEIHGKTHRLLEPLGNTDSELAFCHILTLVQEGDARKISDLPPHVLLRWFQCFDMLGSSDMLLSDGGSIVCFHGTQSPKDMYYTRIQPPDNHEAYTSAAAEIRLSDPRDAYRTALIVSSVQLSNAQWVKMQPGQMIIIRRSVIVWNSHPEPGHPAPTYLPERMQPQQPAAPHTIEHMQAQAEQTQSEAPQETELNIKSITHTPEGVPLSFRVYEVTHETHYEYTTPVEHSTHTFRLQPTNDPVQEVEFAKLLISAPTEKVQYEDVFGNHAIHCIINTPYKKLSVKAISRVRVYARPPDDHNNALRQSTIPLIWMPWQRQMMMPYLLPPELPESQLAELTDYAMSFVERNDYHLLNTIEDINASIYRDYKYVSGSTSLSTTPFDVFSLRQGVCQDFANLFICMARLLSIPARYRMGYIYTGANYANKIQSDASHAWIEVYLPYIGWRGFDPTNGCKVGQEHVRVACGRNYRDATPTSGTIYKGGGKETMHVSVWLRELHD